MYPRHSWLLIEGKLVKSDGETVYADGDLIALTNNALMYCFTNAKYRLSGMKIESLNHPGFASTMQGTLKYSFDFNKGPGLMQCCFQVGKSKEANANNAGFTVRQSYIIKKPNPQGSFRIAVPLEHLFGFCKDYDRVVYGVRHTLKLVRTTDDNNGILKLLMRKNSGVS